MTSDTKRLLDADELGHVLNIPREAVWRLARSGAIPNYRAGRLYRFDLAAVLAALEKAALDEREGR
jgi:excisionase family DNA binding protein